jgi:16S rRNA (guanine966-N2)-methyltransferase
MGRGQPIGEHPYSCAVRIIAGTAKGTRLVAVPPGVRPVSDRAREGLFSSLGDSVSEARVLDLFAGTGALGIEALSRDAAQAVFVDRSPGAVKAVRENLARTRLAGRATVVTGAVERFLAGGDPEPFDLVFLDPPYELGPPDLDRILAGLDADWLAAEGWTTVLTRANRSSTPVIPVNWAVARRLRYGDGLVILFRPKSLEVRWA